MAIDHNCHEVSTLEAYGQFFSLKYCSELNGHFYRNFGRKVSKTTALTHNLCKNTKSL